MEQVELETEKKNRDRPESSGKKIRQKIWDKIRRYEK